MSCWAVHEGTHAASRLVADLVVGEFARRVTGRAGRMKEEQRLAASDAMRTVRSIVNQPNTKYETEFYVVA